MCDLIPEDEEFVSLPDALLYQVEQQHHFCRVLQDAGLVVTHNVLCLKGERLLGFTGLLYITFTPS